MPQSSLTAWLKKPGAVITAPVRVSPADEPTDHEVTGPSDDLRVEHDVRHSTTSEHEDEIQKDGTNDNKAGVTSFDPAQSRSTPPLPPNVQFRRCTKDDIPALKRMNSLLLPIAYPESFYREIISDELTNKITLLAFWHDDASASSSQDNSSKGRLVGAIRCRMLSDPQARQNTVGRPSGQISKPMLYLSTLVLLSPYRSHGIASHLLDVMLKRAVEDYGVGSVGAHVWEANEALEWYRKRGFKEVGREKEYYRKLKPQGAVVVRREVSVMDFLGR